ncbi:MAG: CRISPR-associated protein Cas1 [Nitrospira sp.]|jgi:CRISPR-associated protein Cas1|nr:MAG: CRISPR-associated protein Cas1 [Nitrospira sp.]
MTPEPLPDPQGPVKSPVSPAPVLELLPPVPRQINLYTGEEELPNFMLDFFPPGVQEHVLEEGLAVVQSPEGLTVSLSGFGGYVGKKSERLVLKKKDGKVIWQVPFDHIHELQLASSGLSVSVDAVAALADRGVRVSIVGYDGRPVAQIASPMLTASIQIRRAQLEALGNGRGLMLACAIASGKLLNQARLLKYCVKNLRLTQPELFRVIREKVSLILRARRDILRGPWSDLEKARSMIMGLEGQAAKVYWTGISQLIEKQAEFTHRAHRGAGDFVNSLLNYGYGVLYSQVWGAIQNAGLEPFAGYLHTDRPGKPSLVLDLTEEFRAPVVDRTIIAALRLGQLQLPANGSNKGLDADTRSILVDRLLRRLESRERWKGADYQVRSIIQMQARQVASFLTDRQTRYVPFRFKW